MLSINRKKLQDLLVLLALIAGGFASITNGQSNDEKLVREVLRKNTNAFAGHDMVTLEKLWANDEALTVFENGYANYGWADTGIIIVLQK